MRVKSYSPHSPFNTQSCVWGNDQGHRRFVDQQRKAPQHRLALASRGYRCNVIILPKDEVRDMALEFPYDTIFRDPSCFTGKSSSLLQRSRVLRANRRKFFVQEFESLQPLAARGDTKAVGGVGGCIWCMLVSVSVLLPPLHSISYRRRSEREIVLRGLRLARG